MREGPQNPKTPKPQNPFFLKYLFIIYLKYKWVQVTVVGKHMNNNRKTIIKVDQRNRSKRFSKASCYLQVTLQLLLRLIILNQLVLNLKNIHRL
jgi:hypothetical protein